MILGTREEWWKIMPADMWHSQCVFCQPDITPLLKEFDHWYICRNKYPYLWLKDNLLIIPKKHRKYTYELSPEEFAEFPKLEQFMNEYYGEKEYFSFIRQSCKWRSLEHLHYHYLPWFLSGKDMEYILQQNQISSWKH